MKEKIIELLETSLEKNKEDFQTTIRVIKEIGCEDELIDALACLTYTYKKLYQNDEDLLTIAENIITNSR